MAERGSELSRISVEDFAEATFRAVMRATEARKLPPGRLLGPIIYGIIWYPEREVGEVIGPVAGSRGGG